MKSDSEARYQQRRLHMERLQPLAEALFVALVQRDGLPLAEARYRAHHAWELAEAFNDAKQERLCKEAP